MIRMRKISTNLAVSVIYQLVAILCGFVLPGLQQSISQFPGMITFLDMGLGQFTGSALYAHLSRKNMLISRIMAIKVAAIVAVCVAGTTKVYYRKEVF